MAAPTVASNSHAPLAARGSVTTSARRAWGYVSGFPYPIVPLAAAKLAGAYARGDARGVENAQVLWKMMFGGADFFCSVVWYLRGFYSVSDPYRQAQSFPLASESMGIEPMTYQVDDKLSFQYGANDFDMPERKMSPTYRALYYLMRNAPTPKANHLPFESPEKYQALLRDTFKKTFVALRPIPLPPDDPRALIKYMTHDYGAPLLSKKDGQFVADLSHWENLDLKCGGESCERYGGKLTFTKGAEDARITYLGQTYAPTDPDWARIQYIFMSTALMTVVVQLHTVHVHMLNAGLFALKTRALLHQDHPIYRLFRPFTIKTVAINEHAAHSILGDSGILLHGSALTYGSLKRLYRNAHDTYEHLPLPDLMAKRGLVGGTEDLPYVEEGLRFWKIIADFVNRYVGLYYADDAAVLADTAIVTWFNEIRAGMPPTAGVPSTLSKQVLADFIAVFIWNVTAYHDVSSQTGTTLYDYRLGASQIKRADRYGTWYPNVQEHLVTLLAHQLTTIESVKLTDNFHYWWLDRAAHDTALQFQKELWDFHYALADRNKQRDLTYVCMDPVHIETSVQT